MMCNPTLAHEGNTLRMLARPLGHHARYAPELALA